MKLKMALDEKKLDLRLRDRLVAEGKVTQTELNKFFKDLKDETGNYKVVDPSARLQDEQ
ncbi:MAG: hypothetical protein JNM93_12100 [Bacteriovoracaceae bacterium]|nr:hypothetical protein [Bacteriovoracaceae bacterium]